MRLGAAISSLILGTVIVATVSPAMAQRQRTLRHLLDTVVPDLKFTDVPLSDALDYVRDTTDANMVVDWKSLEAVNIDRNTLINMRLRNVTLRKALSVMLAEAGAGNNVLTFYVEDNILNVTTQAKADTVNHLMVYSVKDLLMVPPNFQLQDASSVLSSLSSGGGGGTYSVSQTSASGGGAQSSNNNTFSSGGSSSSSSTQTTDQQAQALVKLITDTVRPEIWKQNGGTATITYFQGNLIINAPISVLEAIGGPIE